MKIAVITCHNIKNYGSLFQTYATQKYLQDQGHEVVFVDYRREDTDDRELARTRARQSPDIYRIPAARLLFLAVLKPSVKKQIRVFRIFLDRYIRLTDQTFHSGAEIRQSGLQADLYISGSDQIWNSRINRRIETPYFLDFAPEGAPCISLSSSFGSGSVKEEDAPVLRRLLAKYSHISVREKSGEAILARLGFPEGKALPDPVNLLDRREWERLMEPVRCPGEYVLVYHLRPDAFFDQYVEELCRVRKMKPVHILLYYHKVPFRKGIRYVVPSPGQVLSLIAHASCIVTDSFHMCSFAVLYRKQFLVHYPDRYSERLDNLLNDLGLTDRRLTEETDIRAMDIPIDYDRVRGVLDRKVEEMKQWIRECLEEVQQKADQERRKL